MMKRIKILRFINHLCPHATLDSMQCPVSCPTTAYFKYRPTSSMATLMWLFTASWVERPCTTELGNEKMCCSVTCIAIRTIKKQGSNAMMTNACEGGERQYNAHGAKRSRHDKRGRPYGQCLRHLEVKKDGCCQEETTFHYDGSLPPNVR